MKRTRWFTYPLHSSWNWSSGSASLPTMAQLCPAAKPGRHIGAEHQPAPGSSWAPWHSYNTQGGQPPAWSTWRHGVHWPLSRADTSHGDPGPREPAEQHWSQWRRADLARSICHICARSMPCAPEHGGNPWHAHSRFWECVLRQFCSVHGVLVVVSFFPSKQLLGKYPSDRKLSKLWPKHCSCHAWENQKLQVQFPIQLSVGSLYLPQVHWMPLEQLKGEFILYCCITNHSKI